MAWRLLIITIAASFAGYRVWALRRCGISISTALGFSLDRRPFVHLGVGTAITAAAISAVFLSEWASGLLSISRVNQMATLINDFSTYVAVPLIEEFVFRCAVLGTLLLLVPRPSAAVFISAAFFGGMHARKPNASVLSVVSTTLGGLSYGSAYLAAERIWFPLGLHFGWNYFQARVFGFAISGGLGRNPAFIQQHDRGPALLTGGAYGPEGGLIGLGARVFVLVLVLTWIALERNRSSGSTVTSGSKKTEHYA
jgi:membrane protease YdiL (CAAX protease family)